MKICFLAHAGSIHTHQWVRHFCERGHQVSVVTLTPGDPAPGVELHDLEHRWPVSYSRTNWHYLLKLRMMGKVVREVQPDVLSAIFLSSYGLMGALVRPRGCPLAVVLLGSDILFFPRKSLLHRWVTCFVLRRASLIVASGEHVTRVLREYVARGKPVLTTLQYGVDTDLFCPPESPARRRPICLSNRAMVPLSDLETVLLAAGKLKQLGSPVRIHMAGDGEQEAFLGRRATELQLGDRVSFVGRIDHGQMPDLLRSASIYVSMCRSDGMSLSLMEAMACGTFPVVADIPANRELITDGVNGYLVPVGSPECLARRLDDAWNDGALRRAAARHNRALILERGEYRKTMAAVESAFLRLAGQF